MSFFISDAHAEAGAAPAAGDLMSLIPLIVIFVVFYFLLIRPQMKRAKEHRKLTESVAKGDEVVTTGGLLGKVVGVDDNFVSLEVAEGLQVKVQRQSIVSLMPKGTYK